MKTILLTSVALAALLSSCAVGPDYVAPKAPEVKTYADTAMPEKTTSSDNIEGAAQRFDGQKELQADWWKLFGSDALNALMQQALTSNPDLRAAKAALRQAQENTLSERGLLLPAIDAQLGGTRERNNPAAFGQNLPASIFNLYNASVSVSYAVDLFGATRRELEALKALEDFQRYEVQAAYLMLTANVVNAAVQEASLREQIKETQDIIAIQREQAGLLEKQFNLGAIPKTTLLEQQTLVAQTETTLPPLQKLLAQKRNQLAVLCGKFPADQPQQMFDLGTLHLPETIPLALPSSLVQQRPDIRAAEAQLRSALAEVGVATAAMLPRISLSANYGFQSQQIHSVFTPDALAWNLGGNLLQPIFRGGELLHAKRSKQAAFDRSFDLYESTVLKAFQDVADTLKALQYDADALASQVKAEKAAKDSFDLSRTQYEAGAITYSQMLDTQRTWQQLRISLVQAEANRLTDTVALFEALGGGWGNADAEQTVNAPVITKSNEPETMKPPVVSPAPAATLTPPKEEKKP